MKIKTITLHCTDNCGSTLQSLALQKYLSDQGHDTQLVDYTPSYLKYNGSFIKHVIKSVIFFMNWRFLSARKKDCIFVRNAV